MTFQNIPDLGSWLSGQHSLYWAPSKSPQVLLFGLILPPPNLRRKSIINCFAPVPSPSEEITKNLERKEQTQWIPTKDRLEAHTDYETVALASGLISCLAFGKWLDLSQSPSLQPANEEAGLADLRGPFQHWRAASLRPTQAERHCPLENVAWQLRAR